MDALWGALGVVLGGVGAEAIRAIRGRKPDAQALTDQFYELWRKELDRLTSQANALTAEVIRLQTETDHLKRVIAALEAEVIALGGDPKRITARMMRDPDDIDGAPI